MVEAAGVEISERVSRICAVMRSDRMNIDDAARFKFSVVLVETHGSARKRRTFVPSCPVKGGGEGV